LLITNADLGQDEISVNLNKKLNILFLSTWYPNRTNPKLGNFVQKHAESVALNSNVAALFACADSDCKDIYELTEETINGVYTVNVYYKKVTNKIPLYSQILKALRFIKAYKKGLNLIQNKFGNIDIIHHNVLYPTGIVALLLKKIKHVPYLITEHWTGYLDSNYTEIGIVQKSVSKIIASNASYITPVSKDLQNAMQKTGLNTNYEIVYNVVDTNIFYPDTIKHSHQKLKFLHISTLDDAHKNISGMLHATAKLSNQKQDFEFWFVGDGDITPHIKTAKDLGIYKTFAFFEGAKTTTEIARIMRSADCFVLFSNYENLPCVMVEALASGLPIISSATGGIPEHITPEYGYLVQPKDEDDLFNALLQMTDDIKSKKFDPVKLKEYAENNFSYQKVSEKFHQLYNRMLKQHD